MRKKSKTRKITITSKRKKTTSTRKAKPSAKKAAERATERVAVFKLGLAAVPGAMEAAALIPDQKRLIVHHCIAVCAGTTNFRSNQSLASIRQGIEQCVEVCVIDAVHRPLSVRSSDTEDGIVGRI